MKADAKAIGGWERGALLLLTLLLAGRAMTIAFVGRAGGLGPGDPPAAWLMPLVGDAVIGVTAIVIAYLLLRGGSLWAWTAIVAWNLLGIWDAMAAYLVHLSAPWPEFFMIQIFGSAMFFAASAMHGVGLLLLVRPSVRASFGLDRPATI